VSKLARAIQEGIIRRREEWSGEERRMDLQRSRSTAQALQG